MDIEDIEEITDRGYAHNNYCETTLTFADIDKITNGFSSEEENYCGGGGQGNVYKGYYYGREIAIKVFDASLREADEKLFDKDYDNHVNLVHENIVQVYGICRETLKQVPAYMSNKFRAIWMEYIPNHDLGLHLSDESKSQVLDWPKRLQIIMGICTGLEFLHGREPPIRHLDLKPANILLDNNLTPKIADFGLSRIYNDKETRLTESSAGTVEFMPPEYRCAPNQISMKFDIFSLGATMIKIITGPEGNFEEDQTSGKEEYIEKVVDKWRKRPLNGPHQEQHLHLRQIHNCIRIALLCLEENRDNRPDIEKVMSMLRKGDCPQATAMVPCPKIPSLAEHTNRDEFNKMTSWVVQCAIRQFYLGSEGDFSFQEVYRAVYNATFTGMHGKELHSIVETTMGSEVDDLFSSLYGSAAHGLLFLKELLNRWNLQTIATRFTADYMMYLYHNNNEMSVEEIGRQLWRNNMVRSEKDRPRLMDALRMDAAVEHGDTRANVIKMLNELFCSHEDMLKELAAELRSVLGL